MNGDDGLVGRLIAEGVAPSLATGLAAYGRLVLTANQSFNLTGARTEAAFTEHILDALTLANDIDGPLIDLGSGAGLPGIPLALASRQPVVLVDSAKKKALFLRRVMQALDLAGEALDARAETLAHEPKYREAFRYATARAVASAPTVAELTVPFLALDGRALLQRGLMDERERQAVADAAPILGAELVEERLVGGDRRVLILVKRKPTQPRFPRRNGIPEKRPLCLAET